MYVPLWTPIGRLRIRERGPRGGMARKPLSVTTYDNARGHGLSGVCVNWIGRESSAVSLKLPEWNGFQTLGQV